MLRSAGTDKAKGGILGSRAERDAPAAVSASIADAWPILAAKCSGVSPLSVASTYAPAAISARIVPTSPFAAAKCSGVAAYLPPWRVMPTDLASREAPAATITSIAFVCPCVTALCSMVIPASPRRGLGLGLGLGLKDARPTRRACSRRRMPSATRGSWPCTSTFAYRTVRMPSAFAKLSNVSAGNSPG